MDEELFDRIKNNILGYEFDWFAFDKAGQVAVFTTFQGAIVPELVWESYENYGNTLNYFIGLQAEQSKAELLDSVFGLEDDWDEYQKTGLYVYNYAYDG